MVEGEGVEMQARECCLMSSLRIMLSYTKPHFHADLRQFQRTGIKPSNQRSACRDASTGPSYDCHTAEGPNR